MKKDKPSKKKGKPTNVEILRIGLPFPDISFLSLGHIEPLFPSEFPFKKFSEHSNPFISHDDERAIVYEKIIGKFIDFGRDCANFRIWAIGDKEQIELDKKALYKKRSEIISLLKQMVPKPASKKIAHQFIRLCEFYPNLLNNSVEAIVKRLKYHRDLVNKELKYRYKTKEWKKVQALKNFLERDLEQLYREFSSNNEILGIKPFKEKEKLLNISVDVIYSPNDAYPYIALRILSVLADCDYDGLYDIYYPKKSKNLRVL